MIKFAGYGPYKLPCSFRLPSLYINGTKFMNKNKDAICGQGCSGVFCRRWVSALTLGGDLEARMLKRVEGKFAFIVVSIDYHEEMNTLWRSLLVLALGVWQDCWV